MIPLTSSYTKPAFCADLGVAAEELEKAEAGVAARRQRAGWSLMAVATGTLSLRAEVARHNFSELAVSSRALWQLCRAISPGLYATVWRALEDDESDVAASLINAWFSTNTPRLCNRVLLTGPGSSPQQQRLHAVLPASRAWVPSSLVLRDLARQLRDETRLTVQQVRITDLEAEARLVLECDTAPSVLPHIIVTSQLLGERPVRTYIGLQVGDRSLRLKAMPTLWSLSRVVDAAVFDSTNIAVLATALENVCVPPASGSISERLQLHKSNWSNWARLLTVTGLSRLDAKRVINFAWQEQGALDAYGAEFLARCGRVRWRDLLCGIFRVIDDQLPRVQSKLHGWMAERLRTGRLGR